MVRVSDVRARKVFGPTPDQDYIVIEQAPAHTLVAEEFLANLDPRFAHFGDGILTLHGRDGDVSYGLSHYDPYRRVWHGTRCLEDDE